MVMVLSPEDAELLPIDIPLIILLPPIIAPTVSTSGISQSLTISLSEYAVISSNVLFSPLGASRVMVT